MAAKLSQQSAILRLTNDNFTRLKDIQEWYNFESLDDALAYAIGVFHGRTNIFVPSAMEIVEFMLEKADLHRGETVYDLGAGDGRFVVHAAKKYGCWGVGIERNSNLADRIRRRAKEQGVPDRVKVIQRDFRNVSLADADVIIMSLAPWTIQRLKRKILREAKAGCRVLTRWYPIIGWKPSNIYPIRSRMPKKLTGLNHRSKQILFVYELGKNS